MKELTEEKVRAVCNQIRQAINALDKIKEWEKLSPNSDIELRKAIELCYRAKNDLGNL